MYSLIRSLARDRAWTFEAPALAAAWFITETGCKLHSFTLECGVFLALWFLLGSCFRWVAERTSTSRERGA